MWFGCKKKEGGLPTNPQKWLVIDDKTIDNDEYKVPAQTNIYYGPDNSNKIELGHNDLNVKAFSDAHGGVTDFCVKGTIHFGFMVDPSMNFHLMGADNSLVEIDGLSDYACGIIVGSTNSTKTNNGFYDGFMNIENSVNFKISSNWAYGLLFFSSSNASKQIINGVWIFTCELWYGAYFGGFVVGTLTINGLWSVDAGAGNGIHYCGVYFDKDVSGTIVISGVWDATNNIGTTKCIEFYGKTIGTLIINGVWCIRSTNGVECVNFQSDVSGTIFISGVWSIICNSQVVCVRYGTAISGHITINGTFVISAPTNTKSAYFVSTTNPSTGSLSMESTEFFSNNVDKGNTLQQFESCSYKWNGTVINKDNFNTNANAGDNGLSQKQIYDTKNDQDYNFFINVIDTAMSTNKETFNNKLENALDDYIESNDCPIVAEQWLRAIAEQISSV